MSFDTYGKYLFIDAYDNVKNSLAKEKNHPFSNIFLIKEKKVHYDEQLKIRM